MINSLFECTLFRGIASARAQSLIDESDYDVRSYARGDVIALSASRYTALMILVEGTVTAETTDSSGNSLRVEQIDATALIAPTYLFADNNLLPVSLTARTETHIVVIERDVLCRMMSIEMALMHNFMAILSSSNTFISEKVVYTTYKTIKSKFANYLLNRMEECGCMSFRNPISQREMAEMFAVTRPALARAIGELVDDGAIYVRSKEITILYPEKLKQYTKN